jgi:hypothetical protein
MNVLVSQLNHDWGHLIAMTGEKYTLHYRFLALQLGVATTYRWTRAVSAAGNLQTQQWMPTL